MKMLRIIAAMLVILALACTVMACKKDGTEEGTKADGGVVAVATTTAETTTAEEPTEAPTEAPSHLYVGADEDNGYGDVALATTQAATEAPAA